MSDLNNYLLEGLKPFGFSEADSKFLSNMCLTAYQGKFDIDRVVGDEPKHFGFAELVDILNSFIEFKTGQGEDVVDLHNKISNNVLALIRTDVSAGNYIAANLIREDKELYNLLTAESDTSNEEADAEFKKFINGNHAYKTLVDSVFEVVKDVYTCLLQDGYGLTPYEGVLLVGNKRQYTATTVSNSRREKFSISAIENAAAAFSDISLLMESKTKVQCSMARQFDVKRMIESEIPVYYPIKILEYASGLEPLNKTDTTVFKKHSKERSWGKYSEKDENGNRRESNGYFDEYIAPKIKDYVMEALCIVLKRFVDEHATYDIIKTSVETNNRIFTEAETAVGRLQASLCTAFVIVKYNNLGNKVNSITLRAVETIPNSLPTNKEFTKELFSKLTTNKNIEFEDANVISDEVQGKNLAYRVIEYKHDFDSALTNAEPLFGYKAVQMFKSRGVEMSWNKILLGQDTKGTPLFASLTDSQDLPMQNSTVHNMMAGSRAGKGVMTMNILASAIADSKPLFYIDRKPDMAVMFQDLTQGNMFLINGGQVLKKNDPRGHFLDNGDAVAGWHEAYNAMPQYLRDIFTKESYEGDFGDYVYYRGIMLMMGLLMARIDCPSALNSLGGEKGIVVVIDEFKNWQEIFENKYFSITGVFCTTENRITKADEDSYEKYSNDIKTKQAQLNSIAGDEKKQAQVVKLNLDIESLQRKQEKLVSVKKAYCTTVINKFGESIKHMAGSFAAGFKDGEGVRSDIFVIGQNIQTKGYYGAANDTGVYSVTSTGAYNNNNETKNASLIRGLLNNFPIVDWFMGFNHDGEANKKYMGCETDPQSKRWIDKNQYWGYIQGASMDELKTSKPEGTRFFKPYLVLNNNLEDDPKHPKRTQIINSVTGECEEVSDPDYTFVSQCRKRVNDAVPGAELWEKVRLKHIPKELRPEAEIFNETHGGQGNAHYGELNIGIGFEGLIKETMKPSADSDAESVNFDFTSALSESKAIADYVAQAMGYSNYKELLFDFSPKGLFSTVDVVNAINGNASYTDLTKRLPIFSKFGFLDNAIAGANDDSQDGDVDDILNQGVPDDFDEPLEDDDDILNQGVPDDFDEPLEAGNNITNNGGSSSVGGNPEDYEMVLRDANGNPINPINTASTSSNTVNNGVAYNNEGDSNNTSSESRQNMTFENSMSVSPTSTNTTPPISPIQNPLNNQGVATTVQNTERRQMQFESSLGNQQPQDNTVTTQGNLGIQSQGITPNNTNNKPVLSFNDIMAILIEVHGDVPYKLSELQVIYNDTRAHLSDKFNFSN